MTVFVDSSAIYAGIDGDDEVHEEAVGRWDELFSGHDELVTHSLVELESATLIQRRLGMAALRALREVLLPRLRCVEIEAEVRRAAIDAVLASGNRDVSVVDRVSFGLMGSMGIERAFTYDRHFSDAGFEVIG